jgi:hypothetical protein
MVTKPPPLSPLRERNRGSGNPRGKLHFSHEKNKELMEPESEHLRYPAVAYPVFGITGSGIAKWCYRSGVIGVVL